MSKSKKQQKKPAATPAPDAGRPYRVLLWLAFFVNSLFLLPQVLDRYLISRFFFLSAVLLGGVAWLWSRWKREADWRLDAFSLLLLAWYALNAASVSWAFSWSEGVFYTQKVLLLFGVYWLLRQALAADAAGARLTLLRIVNALTLVVSVVLLIQVGLAFRTYGLDNQHLYDYASGAFGNKSLAADFLFFLLAFNVLFYRDFKDRRVFWASVAALGALILVLQVRTVYLAVAAGALLYFPGRAVLEPAFRPMFLKRILPAALTGIALLAAVLAWKGAGSTLAERLNPATYLESASANERRFVWYKTDVLNRDHYWWGVGNGSWKIWFPSKSIEGAYRLMEKSVVFTRAHNDYLEVRAEMGMVGAVLFIALFVAAFLAAGAVLAGRGGRAGPEARHTLLGLSAALLGYCIIQYFDFPRERIEMQALLGLMFAWMAWESRAVWTALPGLSLRKYPGTFLALLAAGLAFNLYIGWNRIKGETHTLKTLEAQSKGNFQTMVREAAAARNAYYEYNDVTLPLSWYEGIGYYQLNQVDSSVVAFEQAYRLNPWAFQVINNYASALVRAKRYGEAIELYQKALAINPRYDEGKFNIAYSWYALGDYAKALDWLARVDTIPNPPGEDERKKNAATLKQKADFEKAIRDQMNGGNGK